MERDEILQMFLILSSFVIIIFLIGVLFNEGSISGKIIESVKTLPFYGNESFGKVNTVPVSENVSSYKTLDRGENFPYNKSRLSEIDKVKSRKGINSNTILGEEKSQGFNLIISVLVIILSLLIIYYIRKKFNS